MKGKTMLLERVSAANGAVYYVSPRLREMGVRHAFSTRRGGVSPAPFDTLNLGNPGRVREKDVTLAMARRLARKLRGAGFEVVLTRRDDRFLALEERTALANTARGDLFVSIHANANPRRNRTGVETYFLNVADDRYAARLAARENGALSEGGEYGPLVQRIRTDLDATTSAGTSRSASTTSGRHRCRGWRPRMCSIFKSRPVH